MKWCASFEVPKAFTSDGGTHLTGQVMQMTQCYKSSCNPGSSYIVSLFCLVFLHGD